MSPSPLHLAGRGDYENDRSLCRKGMLSSEDSKGYAA